MGYGKNLQMLLSEMGIPIVTVAKAARHSGRKHVVFYNRQRP